MPLVETSQIVSIVIFHGSATGTWRRKSVNLTQKQIILFKSLISTKTLQNVAILSIFAKTNYQKQNKECNTTLLLVRQTQKLRFRLGISA